MIPIVRETYKDGIPFSISLINAKHYPAHIHDKEMEIVLCLQGEANVVTAHDTFHVAENQMITLDQQDVHCIYSDSDNLLAIINLDLTKSEVYPFEDLKYRFLTCTTESLRTFHRTYHKTVHKIITSLVYDYACGMRLDRDEYISIYEHLLHLLVDSFSWPYKTDLDTETNPDVKNRLYKINKYVQQNYMGSITIAQLSSMSNLTENYFSQFMKKTSYGGFKEMLAYIRCYNAEYMLLNTDYSGEQISNMCGFSSTKYFYRWFKHFWKRTPLQHKKWYERYINEKDEYVLYPPEEVVSRVQKFIADTECDEAFSFLKK